MSYLTAKITPFLQNPMFIISLISIIFAALLKN